MTDRPAAVISDANVLIDYISVERTMVLRLVSEHLFPIKLPRSILAEVAQLDQDQAEALGMKIVEETLWRTITCLHAHISIACRGFKNTIWGSINYPARRLRYAHNQDRVLNLPSN